MRKLYVLLVVLVLSASASAREGELAFTWGYVPSQDRETPSGSLALGSGAAWQFNFGYQLYRNHTLALFAEVPLLGITERKITSSNPAATRDIDTRFLTPGIRVKFAPDALIQPYFAVGGGYAQYEQSRLRVDDTANQAPRRAHRGAFDFGVGVDFTGFKLWNIIGLRVEVRDVYTGSPAYNIPIGGGQHNVVASGGIVIKWGH